VKALALAVLGMFASGDAGLLGSPDVCSGPDLDGDGRGSDYHIPRESLPLPVVFDVFIEPTLIDVWERQEQWLEQQVGVDLFGPPHMASPEEMVHFNRTGGPRFGGIYVIDLTPPTPTGGSAVHWLDKQTCAIAKATVRLPEQIIRPQVETVVLHEQLHVLGLAHDTDKWSVMYPKVYHDGQVLSTSDLELLRKLYGKGTK
jgi:hypothetical protein